MNKIISRRNANYYLFSVVAKKGSNAGGNISSQHSVSKKRGGSASQEGRFSVSKFCFI